MGKHLVTPLSVRVTAELKQAVRDAARRAGTNVNAFSVKALQDAVTKEGQHENHTVDQGQGGNCE